MRIDQLTFTRFIAAVLIVIFHFGDALYLFTNDYVGFIFQNAHIGLSYFFALSGFVMIVAYHKKDRIPYFQFIKNRLARIYPIYFLAIVLMVRTSIFSGGNSTDVVLNILLLQSWIPGKALTINFPGWSLSVEFFFYAIFPFLFNYLYSKVSLRNCSIIVLLFWIASQTMVYLTIQHDMVVPVYAKKDLLYHPLMHLSAFLMGSISGLYFVRNPKPSKTTLLPIILLTVVLLLLMRFPIGLTYYNGLLSILFVPLLYFIAKSNGNISTFFSKKVFVFLGEASYGIYIYQWPVWNIVSDFKLNKYFGLDKEADYGTMFLIRILVLILVACVSHVYIEKPIRNWITKPKSRSGKINA